MSLQDTAPAMDVTVMLLPVVVGRPVWADDFFIRNLGECRARWLERY